MKKTAVVLAAVLVIVLGLMFFGNLSEDDEPTPDAVSTDNEIKTSRQELKKSVSHTDDTSDFMRDDFDQLSQDEKNEMMDEYILDFWANELGMTEDSKEKNLSLEIFNRPYMKTISEQEFTQLSTADQGKAIAEVMQDCQKVRSYVLDLKAEAESYLNDGDHKNAEAHYIHCLKTGRELSKNKDGLLIARLVGIACEKVGLNGLVKLYEKTGDNTNLQFVRDQLSEIDRETEEIKRIAKETQESI